MKIRFFVHGFEMDERGTVYIKGGLRIDKDNFQKKLLSFSNGLTDLKEYTLPSMIKKLEMYFMCLMMK